MEPNEKSESGATIPELESFLKKCSSILHPNHVIMIDKKYHLAKMYGRMNGFEADQLSDELFERKKQLCQEVLKVLDVITPGRQRKRGWKLS